MFGNISRLRVLSLVPHTLLVFYFLFSTAYAAQTGGIELGNSGVYDDSVKITRSSDGQMVFRDSIITTPVTLEDLAKKNSDHNALDNLATDGHPQYLNSGRHLSEHSESFDTQMTIPSDVGGNTTLGTHVVDSDIHPSRSEAVEISGNWRFTGTPQVWNGLTLSNGGESGDSSLSFATSGDSASIAWDETDGRFVWSRDTLCEKRLRVVNGIEGDVINIPRKCEHLWLPLDDVGSTGEIMESTGRYPKILMSGSVEKPTESSTVTGVLDYGIAFDGLDDYINIPIDESPMSPYQTITFWIRRDATPTGTSYVLDNNTFNQSGIACMFTTTGRLQFRMSYQGGSYTVNPIPSVTSSVWYHIAIAGDENELRVYCNGALVGSTGAIPVSFLGDKDMRIGKSGSVLSVACSFDDFRIYGSALSEDQITALYNEGAGSTAPERTLSAIDGALNVEKLGIGGRAVDGILQVGNGAYCDGNQWVDVSTQAAKCAIVPADAPTQWDRLDDLNVVQFSYRKRNPSIGHWLDPSGAEVTMDSEAYRDLTKDPGSEAWQKRIDEGYTQDKRPYLDEADPATHIGFIAEDLQRAAPELSRGDGVAPLEIAAFNTVVLQEAKKRIVSLEKRTAALEALVSRISKASDTSVRGGD
jgi:hypothetical protein